MKIKEALTPVNGIFTNMPQDIWGAELDPAYLDIEAAVQFGNMQTSPMFEYYVDGSGVLDTSSLAAVIYQRYSYNWQRVWDALRVEYNILLTSSTKEQRDSTHTVTDLETRNLTDNELTTDARVSDDENTNIKSGAVDRTGLSKVDYDSQDLETRALNGGVNDGGSETEATTYGKKNTTAGTFAQTGDGSVTHDNGVYGVGSAALAKESKLVDDEARNFTDTTAGTDQESGSDSRATTFGKTIATTDAGNVTNAKSGDDTTTVTDRESYDDLTDLTTSKVDQLDTKTSELTNTGTVNKDLSDVFTESFTSEGSTPLRTFPALIQEEIDGRTGGGWNFTQIILTDVRKFIAGNVWVHDETL